MGPGGRSVSLNVFWVIALASGSRRKDLARAFLRQLATAPMDKLTTLEGAIGVRRSTWGDEEVNRLIPFYHRLDALHEHARELPLHPRLAGGASRHSHGAAARHEDLARSGAHSLD